MIRLRRPIVAGLIGLCVAIGWWSLHVPPTLSPRPPAERPALLLVTSLPLIFGEQFALGDVGSPALTRLRQRYRVEPIPITDEAALRGHRLLLMAHPRAQPAEALVALDAWVHGGGRLLLLADPLLEWPSQRPLGDLLRPPPRFADTGLLAHWGLRLAPPVVRGPVEARLDGRPLHLLSPGTLTGTGFTILAGGRAARGAIGRGRVTIIADADWLDDPADLEPLVAELARLER